METWPTLLPSPSIDYSVAARTANITTPMESGRVRKRRRFSQQYRSINVVWEMDDSEFAFFQGFHENKISNGADDFTISLPIGGGMRSFTASFGNDGNYDASHEPVLNWKVKAVLDVQVADVITASEFDALVTANSLATIGSYL